MGDPIEPISTAGGPTDIRVYPDGAPSYFTSPAIFPTDQISASTSGDKFHLLMGNTYYGTIEEKTEHEDWTEIRGATATNGDRTLWKSDGYHCYRSADLKTIILDWGDGQYQWPDIHPTSGRLLAYAHWTFDGSTWEYRIGGELITPSSTTANTQGPIANADSITVGGSSRGS